MRQPKRHLAFRQAQVGVERGDVEVRLRIVRIAIRIVVLRRGGRRRRRQDRRRLRRRRRGEDSDDDQREQELKTDVS